MGIWGPGTGLQTDSKSTTGIAASDQGMQLNLAPAVIGSAIQLGGAIYNAATDKPDSVDSKGRVWCDGRPSDLQIQAVLTKATSDELQPFRVGWAKEPGSINGSVALEAADPSDVGYWLWGHRDCKHSSAQGYADRDRMLTLISRYAPAGGLLTPYPQSSGGLPAAGNGQPAVSTSASTPISGCVQVGNTTVCGSTGGAQPKPTFSAGIGLGLDNILIIGIVILVAVLLFRK